MIDNFLFCSLDFCHAFKLFNLRTYFNFRCCLLLLCSQYFSSAHPSLLKKFSCSCRCIFFNTCFFFVQCFVYHCLSFSPFSFDHYMVLPFDIQILITPLLYSKLSSVHNRIYHNSTIQLQ